MYATVFNGEPFFEDWTVESAFDEINYQVSNDGFVSVLDLNGYGFAWGYALPVISVGRVDYSRIVATLEQNGFDPAKSFYAAEAGVLASKRNKGLATRLMSTLRDEINEYESVIFRTKNPIMLGIGEKIFGKYVLSAKEDSSYEGGMMYVFKQY